MYKKSIRIVKWDGCTTEGTAMIALAFILAILSTTASASQVVVYDWDQLVNAVNNESVNHVIFGKEVWNMTEESMKPRSMTLNGRVVMLEGMQLPDGGQVYIDGNQIKARVTITGGAHLIQRNFWVDDCFLSKFPYICFSDTYGGGSRIELRNITLSDAHCRRTADSVGIDAMLKAAQIANMFRLKVRQINERELYIEDTGWVSYLPPTAYWRLVNTTLSCTGDVTHPMPDEEVAPERKMPNVLFTVMMVSIALVYWVYVNEHFMPIEQRIAKTRNYSILSEIGSGQSGRVFKGLNIRTGKLVAIKIISLKPNDWEHLASAWRECQVMSAVRHPGCIDVFNYYGCKMEPQALKFWEFTRRPSAHQKNFLCDITQYLDVLTDNNISSQEIEYAAQRILGVHPPSPTNSQNGFAAENPPLLSKIRPKSSKDCQAPPRHHLQDLYLGSLELQVHIVMEYADRGTLLKAVRDGVFKTHSGEMKMTDIVITALDIAKGLNALHQPGHRLVHRDVSPNNILLVSSDNDRGFNAKLSDFGLSTILSLSSTHKITDARGTLAYMPPELFSGIVSTALDVYSFGILMYFMVADSHPYRGFSTAGVVHYKVSSGNDQVRIADRFVSSDDHVMQEWIRLVKECTKFDRHQRIHTENLVSDLERLGAYCHNNKVT